MPDHWFGLPAGAEAEVAWGARAIYKNTYKMASEVDCPTCHAWAGRACRTKSRKERYPHKAREALAGRVVEIDLLWDRQQGRGPDEGREALGAWLNSTALPWLRKECAQQGLEGSSSAVVSWDDSGYRIAASPNASYGYLYIVAYKIPAAVPHEALDT